MKGKKKALWIGFALLVIALIGCGNKTEEVVVRTFADWTDEEVFQTVPAMVVEGTKISEAEACSGDMFLIDVSGTTLDDYKAYLKTLETAGFTHYADNGEGGLEGYVYTATYTKDKLVVTVTQTVKTEKTYIVAGQDQLLSEHLLYNESYVEGNKSGAKTTLHAMELYDNGNSFLIQLKNGHFIMNDGGHEEDLAYLLDYMESLVPEGEKPVVDAWFVSHTHTDHTGCLNAFAENPSFVNRLSVEAFYFNEPSSKSNLASSGSTMVLGFMIDYKFLKNSAGKTPDMYYPQMGQRYFFNDVTVDVVFSQEIHPIENYGGGYNDTSTWLMYTIEGQKILIPGDGDYGSMQAIMNIYDKTYFDLDLFAVSHHGINVYDYFTDFLTLKTVIYTNYRIGSLYSSGTVARETGNTYLTSVAKEIVAWGDGTKTFTFPYEIGSVVTQPANDYAADNVYRKAEAWGERLETYKTYILNQ